MKLDERPRILEGLKSPEPWRRIDALKRMYTVGVDASMEEALLDALDDPGVHEYRERDWDDIDDERAMRTVVVRVAEVAVKILGGPKRRASSVTAIVTRIASRDASAVSPLFVALGELAPESTDFLLGALAHADLAFRLAAARALRRAVFFSYPAQKLAVLHRAIDGLADPSLAAEWLELLEHKHGLFAGYAPHGVREEVRKRGADVDTLERWLRSDVLAVREIAISMLACVPDDERARTILASRIVSDLSRSLASPVNRDSNGIRQCTEVELAVHILCYDATLGVVRAHDTATRAALRSYALAGLAERDPWFLVIAVANQLTDEPDVTEHIVRRLEEPHADKATGPFLTLLAAHARAQSVRRAELVRRATLAMLASSRAALYPGALRPLASVDAEAFTATVLPILQSSEPSDAAVAQIASGLEAAGRAALTALPVLELLHSRTLDGASTLRRAIAKLQRLRQE